jgi:molybdate transport system substrate-binding protein
LSLVAAACGQAAPASPPAGVASPSGSTASFRPGGGNLRIAASSSLTDAFNAMAPGFEAANPTLRPAFSFGPSRTMSTLAQAGGADLFAADDVKATAEVVANRKAAGPAAPFASAAVVLVVAPGNPGSIRAPSDLAKAGVRIGGLSAGTALADATDEVVAKLAAVAGYPANFAAAVKTNTRPGGDDARALVTMLGAGQFDAAFVFRADARTQTTLVNVVLPDEAKVSTRMGVVVLAGTVDREAASAFVQWMTGPEGQATLLEYGFGPPSGP